GCDAHVGTVEHRCLFDCHQCRVGTVGPGARRTEAGPRPPLLEKGEPGARFSPGSLSLEEGATMASAHWQHRDQVTPSADPVDMHSGEIGELPPAALGVCPLFEDRYPAEVVRAVVRGATGEVERVA